MKRKLAILLMGVAMTFALMACGSEEEDTTAQVEEVEEAEEAEEEEEEVIEFGGLEEAPEEGMVRSYITGEWVDEEVAETRPIAFMIENSADCIPNYGIIDADIIYEFEAEGGIPRMMAIFSDIGTSDKIGNTRSCREYFAYTAIAWDAIYVHCGSAYEAKINILDQGLVDNIWLENNDYGAGWRDPGRNNGVHSLYATADGIRNAIEKNGYSTTHDSDFEGYFVFNQNVEEVTLDEAGGEDAIVVDIPQKGSKPWVVYDEDEGVYYKYQYGDEHCDANTGEQLSFENIIIQSCSTEYYYDVLAHDRTRIGFVGSGNAWYVTNGKAIPITWSCDGYGEVTHYYYSNGREVELNRGKTWVDVIDSANEDSVIFYASEDESNH